MKTSVREQGGIVIADLVGRLTMGDGDRKLHDLIDDLLADGHRRIVLNLSGLEYIDSSGLGELVGSLRTTRAMGATLRILNPGGRVYDTLSLARLLPLFEVFQSEEEVIQSFANGTVGGAESGVRCEIDDGVATITLDRPARLNALNRQMVARMVSLVSSLREDERARVLILTGGGRAFCFGADVEELREGKGVQPTLEMFQTVVRDLAFLPKPVIAAVNGFATGAGLELALAADLRVMSEKAKLASAFIRFGLVPDGGSTHLLPRLIGPARAADLVLTGRSVDAATALSWGLVNHVVPTREVLPTARQLALELARGPSRALARAKLLLRMNPIVDLSSALSAEAREQAVCLGEEEFREGLHAHIEKREPRFRA